MSAAKPGPKTVELGYVAKSFQYVVNLINAGEDASNPDLFTDLETSVRNAHRVLWAIQPPATIDERLSYIVSTLAVLDRRTEDMSQIADDTKAAVDAAAGRVITAIGDVAALTAERDAAQAAAATAAEAQATAEANSATSEAARAQAQADLDTANANLATVQAALDAALADDAADAVTLTATIAVADSIAPVSPV